MPVLYCSGAVTFATASGELMRVASGEGVEVEASDAARRAGSE